VAVAGLERGVVALVVPGGRVEPEASEGGRRAADAAPSVAVGVEEGVADGDAGVRERSGRERLVVLRHVVGRRLARAEREPAAVVVPGVDLGDPLAEVRPGVLVLPARVEGVVGADPELHRGAPRRAARRLAGLLDARPRVRAVVADEVGLRVAAVGGEVDGPVGLAGDGQLDR
jgi:hypothetical protein